MLLVMGAFIIFTHESAVLLTLNPQRLRITMHGMAACWQRACRAWQGLAINSET